MTEQTKDQTRIAIVPAPGIKTLYANAFQTSFAQGEILVNALVSRREEDAKGPVLALQPQASLAMTPEAARRLLKALGETLRQYDAAFGGGDQG